METTCRLCADIGNSFLNIFNCETGSQLKHLIFETTTIHIQEEDQLPYVICVNCSTSLENFDKFRKSCIKTQVLLSQLFTAKSTQDECTKTFNHDVVKAVCPSECPRQECQDEEISPEIYEKNPNRKHLTKEERREIYRASLRPCDKCGVMIEKTRLEQHLNQHLGVQPYRCDRDECDGKSFFSSHLLRKHMTHYHSGRSFTCEICGKSYNLQKSYYNHQQKHKEPRYNCKFCHRRYKNNTHLKQHIRTHTGERPYKCTHCEKAFATQYNLKAHIRSHTKDKPFACDECGISYGYNKLLKLHMKKNHPSI